MMVFREYRDGQALIREEWRLRLVAFDSAPWRLQAETYTKQRKNNPRNKHWVAVARWNIPFYGESTRLDACPAIPDDLVKELRDKLVACPVVFGKTEPWT